MGSSESESLSTDERSALRRWCAGSIPAAAELALVLGLADGLPLPAHMAAWALLWALYVSIINVGQQWYGYGWELLLVETGFAQALSQQTPVGAVRWACFGRQWR